MKIIPQAGKVLKRAWSVRAALFIAALDVAREMLPQFAGVIPPGTFAALSFAVIAARIVAQEDVS